MKRGDSMGNEIELRNIDGWCEQLAYWRTHVDVFIEQVLGIKLFPHQKVLARACGNCTKVMIVASRGFGKSWEAALICIALSLLYPMTPIGVVSATAQQATIVLKKIRDFVSLSPVIAEQVRMVGREPVVISKIKGVVYWKNGSKIESYSTTSVVGERLKVIIADENYRILEEVYKKNVLPCANYTRDICLQNNYDDFESKIISITSASLKSNYFYSDFVSTYKDMLNGNKKAFACALDYNAAVHMGITKAEFFDERRKELPEAIFQSEYGSFFLGEEENSIFPFALTSSVRKLKRVEYEMPKGSKSYYIMSVDLATSGAKGSDNAVITVLKCTDRDDGSIHKQLVYIRSYNGRRLDELADEVRMTYVRFPNTRKIIFDQRGLGDSFPAFFDSPWVDPETDREYPAWCLDDQRSAYAEPMLHSFKATLSLNQELVSALRISLEQKTLSIPVESRSLDEDGDGGIALKPYERAIYIETDALQVEMGNLVMRVSSGTGNVTYDTAKKTQHKDRYSSLAMGVWYVAQLENENKKRLAARSRGTSCVGVVSYF